MTNDAAIAVKTNPPTAVLLCENLARLGTGLNLEEVRSWLEARFPHVAVQVVSNLCNHPGQLPLVVARRGAARAVLGLCSREYPQVELQARARRMGMDPFGLEVVPLGTLCASVHPKPRATRRAAVLLAAAVARASAFPGSGPEHSKLYLLSMDQKVTRRSLFTLPPIGYRPVPAIQQERCAAEAGCQLCATTCPRDALHKQGGRILLDKARCEGCGVCLAACPREAVEFPGWSMAQLEAEVSTLVDLARSGGEPFGVLFACQKATGKLEGQTPQDTPYLPYWLPVTVPCLGMLTPTWLFQTLAHGADAVSLLSCGADCPYGQQQAIGGLANFSRKLLRLLGHNPNRVQVISASHPKRLRHALPGLPFQGTAARQGRWADPLRLGTLNAMSRAILWLEHADDTSSKVVLEHPYSPFGILELQSQGCTACQTCVGSCPTGALLAEVDTDKVRLTWLASLCTGCGICADLCPETGADVLRVRRITDLDRLSQGRALLHEDQLATCEGCGAGIVSHALLRRLEGTLGKDADSLHVALSRYCPSCRPLLAWGAAPASISGSESAQGRE